MILEINFHLYFFRNEFLAKSLGNITLCVVTVCYVMLHTVKYRELLLIKSICAQNDHIETESVENERAKRRNITPNLTRETYLSGAVNGDRETSFFLVQLTTHIMPSLLKVMATSINACIQPFSPVFGVWFTATTHRLSIKITSPWGFGSFAHVGRLI